MVQRKGKPVADSRSSEDQEYQEGLLQAWPGFPLPLQPWGILLLTQLKELKEVSLNWSPELIKDPNLVDDKP